jgi:hypothetical protein
VVLVWDSRQLQTTTMYGMGPEVMPVVIAVGLGLLAIGNLIDALRGNLPPRESADPKAVWLILGGLALLIAIIGFGGGFILATSALFVTTSAAFGRRAIPRRLRHRARDEHADLSRLRPAADVEPSLRALWKDCCNGNLSPRSRMAWRSPCSR